MAELGTELGITPSDDGVVLTGEIDAHTAPSLEKAVNDLLEGGREQIALDIAGVTFMDSSGLRVVIAATDRARKAGGDVELRKPTTTVRRLIEISGLGSHLTTTD